MTRQFIISIFAMLCLTSVCAADSSVEDTHNWGIGLQGNFPLWGGLSIKYKPTPRLQFQFIEHYVQNGDEFSAMIGVQTPITMARYPWTRVYLAPGVGFLIQRELQPHFYGSRDQIINPGEPPVFTPPSRLDRTVDETTLGSGFLIGLELFLDNIFTSSNDSRYGLNIEFGQGFGQVDRDATCVDEAGKIIDCDAIDDLRYLRDDPNYQTGKKFRASFVVGFGFHIYF
jgi:hypothetical protein